MPLLEKFTDWLVYTVRAAVNQMNSVSLNISVSLWARDVLSVFSFSYELITPPPLLLCGKEGGATICHSCCIVAAGIAGERLRTL